MIRHLARVENGVRLKLGPLHPALRGWHQPIKHQWTRSNYQQTFICQLAKTENILAIVTPNLCASKLQKSAQKLYEHGEAITHSICDQNTAIKGTNHDRLLPTHGISKPSYIVPFNSNLHLAKQADGLYLQHTKSIHLQHRMCQSSVDKHFILTPKGLLQASPPGLKPYLNLIRFDKPIGTWLLYLPCMWSISLAASPGCFPDISMLALFGMGAFLMRGAGCIINDMWDKDYDKKVTRTRDRPLASEQLSYFQALTFLGLNLSGALAILLTMNWNTVFLGTCAMVPVIIYPLMKRVTYWPQAFLGLTLNWGVLLAWSGLHGHVQIPGAILYISCVLWTIIYDTIYSHQDKEDDILIGVKSTALMFGDSTKTWLYGFSSVMLSGLTLTGVMCDQTWPYFLGVSGVAAHLLYQISTVNLNNPDDCAAKFRSNRNMGLLFWMAIVFGTLLRKPKDEQNDESSTTETKSS